MINEVDKNEKKSSILWMKIILAGLGSVFILVGIISYWLVFNNIVLFTNNKDKENKVEDYYQNVYSL